MTAAADRRDRPRAGLWLVAAIAAFACHIAFAAFAIARLDVEPDEDELGAPGIEIAFEITSAPTQPANLPPGPTAEESAAAPPTVEQQSAAKDADLPKETPVETENPDRVVTTNPTQTKVEEETPQTPAIANPSKQSVAQEAMAAPTVERAPESAKSTTRSQGSGQSLLRDRITWQKELLAHLDRFKRYPSDRTSRSAETVVALTLDRMGHVLSASIAKSSGDAAFDAAAVAMVQRADPVPAPPPLVADEGLAFSLPVKFRERR